MSHEKNLILVTGATGNVGRQVVSQLLDTGARVRALTRNPDSTKAERQRGTMELPSNEA